MSGTPGTASGDAAPPVIVVDVSPATGLPWSDRRAGWLEGFPVLLNIAMLLMAGALAFLVVRKAALRAFRRNAPDA